MSLVSSLLNAQKRPEEEAARLTAAAARALEDPRDEWYEDAQQALTAESRAIAEEKNPPPPPPSDHELARFSDQYTTSTPDDDAEAVTRSSHAEQAIRHFAIDDPTDEAVDMPSDAQPPEEDAPSSVEGMFDALPAAGSAGDGAEQSDSNSSSAVPWNPDTGDGPTFVPGSSHDLGPAAAAAAPVDSEPVIPEGSNLGFDDDLHDDAAAAADDAARLLAQPDEEDEVDRDEEGADESFADAVPMADPGPAAAVAPSDPWSGGEELTFPGGSWNDPSEPIATVPDPVADSVQVQPEPEQQPPAMVMPAVRATEPPKSIEPSDPDEKPGLIERIGEKVTELVPTLIEKFSWKKALIGVGALIVIVMLGTFILGSGGRGEAPQVQTEGGEKTTAVAEPAQEKKEAKPLNPKYVDASCPNTNDALAPFDYSKKGESRAWVCERMALKDGAILNIEFAEDMVITSMRVVPGFAYVTPDGEDKWTSTRVVTGVTWRMGNERIPQQIVPSRSGSTKNLDKPITTRLMSMTITGTQVPKDDGSGKQTPLGGKEQGKTKPEDVDKYTAIKTIEIMGYPLSEAANYAPKGTNP